MRIIYFKDDPVPIIMVRDQPTTHPIAQVLGKMKAGRKKIWMFETPREARLIGIRICFDTLGVEESESFRLNAFIIRRPRSVRYGLELVKGRVLCTKCQCHMVYEVFGQPRCKYHYRAKHDAGPCPTCQPKAPISNSKRKRMKREAQAQEEKVRTQGKAGITGEEAG